jgi:hypothetical protein
MSRAGSLRTVFEEAVKSATAKGADDVSLAEACIHGWKGV